MDVPPGTLLVEGRQLPALAPGLRRTVEDEREAGSLTVDESCALDLALIRADPLTHLVLVTDVEPGLLADELDRTALRHDVSTRV